MMDLIEGLPALSLWQPWASFMAVGLKWIETRSWPTKYRGWVILHAALNTSACRTWERPYLMARHNGPGGFGIPPAKYALLGADPDGHGPLPLPTGLVLASGRLVDVLPIYERDTGAGASATGPRVVKAVGPGGGLWIVGRGDHNVNINDQIPFGDWSTNDEQQRFAWLFEDLAPTSKRCPACHGCLCPPCPGRGNDGTGVTHCAECCFGTGVEADMDCPVHGAHPYTCPVCANAGTCDPVPASGGQRLWRWRPKVVAA